MPIDELRFSIGPVGSPACLKVTKSDGTDISEIFSSARRVTITLEPEQATSVIVEFTAPHEVEAAALLCPEAITLQLETKEDPFVKGRHESIRYACGHEFSADCSCIHAKRSAKSENDCVLCRVTKLEVAQDQDRA
jgi:hypothetical protein